MWANRSVAIVISVVIGLSGCRLGGGQPECSFAEPDWVLDVSLVNGDYDDFDEARTLMEPGGGIIVVISNASRPVQLGTQELRGPALAHVNADGQVDNVAMAQDVEAEVYATGVGIDDAGQVVVAWGGSIVAHDVALQPRWAYFESGVPPAILDVGPAGETVYLQAENLFSNKLTYIDADGPDLSGLPRWTVPVAGNVEMLGLRVTAAGDVVTIGRRDEGVWRGRFAAADGALIEDAEIIPGRLGLTVVFDREGGLVVAALTPESSKTLSAFDANGQLRWEQQFDVEGLGAFGFADDGNIIVPAQATPTTEIAGLSPELGFVMRLDGATGQPIAAAENCGVSVVLGGDANHYVARAVLGVGKDYRRGVARFLGP